MGKSVFTCKICKEKYTSLEGLYSHLEEEHSTQIPPDMSVEQFYYFLKTGREHGNCVMCKKPTTWNEKTKKYHRFCGDPSCKMKYKETVDNRMIGKYGKVNLLNDPDQQRKMLMNRSISGTYNFDGVEKNYVGSYELDFLKTMDLFFDWDPNDIEMPSPHTYYYKYDGEEKFYIPDAFIMSLGLEIEIKDGGNNPNMHHKIQDVDKEKERLKDEVMKSQKVHHYIKLTNKNYYNLFEFFKISKEYVEKYGDYEKIPKIIITDDIGAKKVLSSSKSLMKKEVDKAVNESMETITDESYVCFPLLNGIISSQYKDIKTKDQYRKDVDGFKKHFLQGIDLVKTPDDALAMKTDLETMNKYLHDIKYSNKHSTFKNTQAVNEIENWINRVALPTLEKKTKKLTPVTEYNHYITFSLNNKMNKGLYGFIDNKSSIIFDDKVQIKRKNNIITTLTEGLELEDDVTNITFGFNDDIDINITGNKTQGAYLRWNKDDDINTLIENVSKEWFNSKLKIENLHRIEGDDN